MREFLKRVTVEGRDGQDGDLIAGLPFMRIQASRERLHGRMRQDMSEIDDAPGQRRDIKRQCAGSYRHG